MRLPIWALTAATVLAACTSGSSEDTSGGTGIPSSSAGTTNPTTGTTTTTDGTESSTDSSTSGDCTPGTEGCECVEGQCLGADLVCVDGTCVPPDCVPDPDFDTDPFNCGQCGVVCREDHFMGRRCDAGTCLPSLVCGTTATTCAEACAQSGETCVANACPQNVGAMGHTYFTFFTLADCEDPEGNWAGGAVAAGCDETIDNVTGTYACCCTDTPD